MLYEITNPTRTISTYNWMYAVHKTCGGTTLTVHHFGIVDDYGNLVVMLSPDVSW